MNQNTVIFDAFLSKDRKLVFPTKYKRTVDSLNYKTQRFVRLSLKELGVEYWHPYLISDSSRPVRFVLIFGDKHDKGAPFKVLKEAQDIFLKEDPSCFSEYKPIVYISIDEEDLLYWHDTNRSIHQLRAFRVTDSSIWNYHIYFTISDTIVKYEKDRLEWILSSIYDNYERGLYYLFAGYEYANLNARLVQESKLIGEHAPICPFIFHSEYEMKKQVDDEASAFCQLYCKEQISDSLRWRLLLIDDKSMKAMTSRIEKKRTNKLDVIEPLICELFRDKKISHRNSNSTDPVDNDAYMLIEYAENIDDGIRALQSKKYDIVLLDYLLSSEGQEIHYGYELLERMKEVDRKGPGRFQFFMFISAYVTAVNERLNTEMLDRDIKDVWHISEGACPTNTPNRFKLLLLRLMRKRIIDSGLERLSSSFIANDLAYTIFQESEGLPSVRNRANKSYQDCLSLLYHYRRILADVEVHNDDLLFNISESVLMTSMFRLYPHLGGFLEHFCNLVHITAFGTVRQWPEMWEEYIYFKTQLRDMYKSEKVPFESICKAIESHILSLKSLTQS